MTATPAHEHKFLELVNENRQRILRLCRAYAWNSADQDDLYQEVLFQIWRGLPALKSQQFANTWLYRVAINTAISFVRKRTSSAGRVVHFEHAELAQIAQPGPNSDAAAGRIADLYNAIYKLGPLEKAVVILFLEDLSYEQIAEATGMSANHVGVMLHRAKKRLSGLMLQEEAP